jgi:hypothetical protein
METRIATLLYMVASLEDTIARLEDEPRDGTSETIRRLRVVQGDILTVLRRLEGDVSHSD